jgi:hypothetical protein
MFDCVPLAHYPGSTYDPHAIERQQLYRAQAPDEVQGKTFPIFTAIITVDKGVVTVRYFGV